MGIMCAYILQKELPGVQITLHDPAGFPADNASFMAAGMLAPLSELDHMPMTYLKAGFESIKIWTDIPGDFEMSINGSLLIAHDHDRHMLERFKSILPNNDTWQTVNPQEIEPALSFRNAILTKGEAHLHPQKAMHALLNEIKNKSTQSIDIEKEKADWIIDCRGLATQDQDPALRGVKGETVIVHNPDFTLSRPVRLMHPRYPLYIIPRADNIFMIGATIIENASTGVSLRSAMELLSAAYTLHPSFAEATIIDIKAGIRPSYTDNMPRITLNGNIIRCNGLFRHGYLCAPIMAKCVHSLITGNQYEFNPLFIHDYRPEAPTSSCHSEGLALKNLDPSTLASQDDNKQKEHT